MGMLIIPEEQIVLLQDLWERVLDVGEEKAGVSLFKNIFDDCQEAAKLFSFLANTPDFEFATLAKNVALVKHAVGVIRTVSAVVGMLEEDEMISPMLMDLGARHQLYAVKKEHYDIVGSALLKTVKSVLEEDYTDEARKAFEALWARVIATFMLSPNETAIHQAKQDLGSGNSPSNTTDESDFDDALITRWSEEVRLVDSPPTPL